jgi:hypothetical protein
MIVQITGAAFIGTIGINWRFSGVGNFSGVPGVEVIRVEGTAAASAQQPASRIANKIAPSLQTTKESLVPA